MPTVGLSLVPPAVDVPGPRLWPAPQVPAERPAVLPAGWRLLVDDGWTVRAPVPGTDELNRSSDAPYQRARVLVTADADGWDLEVVVRAAAPSYGGLPQASVPLLTAPATMLVEPLHRERGGRVPGVVIARVFDAAGGPDLWVEADGSGVTVRRQVVGDRAGLLVHADLRSAPGRLGEAQRHFRLRLQVR